MDLGVETRGSKEAVMLTSQQRVDLKDLGILSDSCDLGTKRMKGQSYLQNNECKTDSLFEHWVDIFLLLTLCKNHLVTHRQESEMCVQHTGGHPKVLGAPHTWAYQHSGSGATQGSCGCLNTPLMVLGRS